MGKKANIQYTIAKNVLNNTLTATAWIFELLINMGILTVEAFLSPSLYKEPVYFSLESINDESVRKNKKNKPNNIAIKQSLWRLKKSGFVGKSGKMYYFTKKGKNLASYILARKKIIEKKWDGKYRIVIFDIPETKNKDRDWLRQELYLIGFKKLQESVMVGKNSLPEDLIRDIKRRKIGNFVNYILAEKIYANVFSK